MKYIDAFTHFFPRAVYEKIFLASEIPDMGKRMMQLPAIFDLDTRLRLIEQFEEYRQVISLGMPPLEEIAGPEQSPDLARLANDEQSALVTSHPSHFFGYAAALPMNNPAAAAAEARRVLTDPNCVGLQIHTNILGRPLDEPVFAPVFEAASESSAAILLHPNRGRAFPDYQSEDFSHYEIWQVLGWPYETSVAMARLVLSGTIDRYPGIRVLTHHLGGMIPFFEGRVAWRSLGKKSSTDDYSGVLEGLKKAPLEYFRDFYGDTAMTMTKATLACGLEFFGSSHVVFASDCPFPNGTTDRIRSVMSTIQSLELSEEDMARIAHQNASSLFRRGAAQ